MVIIMRQMGFSKMVKPNVWTVKFLGFRDSSFYLPTKMETYAARRP